MQLIVFSKMLKDRSLPQLIELAHTYGYEGYDLCVRPGYPISPDNAHEELVAAVGAMRQEGLDIPMVTGNFDLLKPDHPTAEPILSAMDQADVRLIKLGYFKINPVEQDYWQYIGEIREALEGWQKLGERYNVKICYHTHSGNFMGLNCAALMHMINGFDPRYIGAYIDPGHMAVNGEPFALGVAMVRKHLSMIAVKDVLTVREAKDGHGSARREFVQAGEGMVDWTDVFAELKRVGFDGPVSVHCEFQVAPEQFLDALGREVAFFRNQRDRVASGS